MKTIRDIVGRICICVGLVLLFSSAFFSYQAVRQILQIHDFFGVKFVNFSFFLIFLPLGLLWRGDKEQSPSTDPPSKDLPNRQIPEAFISLLEAMHTENIVEIFLDSVEKILHPKHIFLYLYDPQKRGFQLQHQEHPSKQTPPAFYDWNAQILKIFNNNPAGWTIIGDANPSSADTESITPQRGVSKQWLIPFRSQRDLLGWLTIEPFETQPDFSISELKMVELLTNQFSLIFHMFASDKVNPLQTEQIQVLCRILVNVNTATDLDQICAEIFSHLQGLLNINDFSLVLKDPQTDVYRRMFLIHNDETVVKTKALQLINGNFLEKRAIETGQIDILEKNGSWLVLPLIQEKEAYGALLLGSENKIRLFNNIDIHFLNALSSTLTSVIQKQLLKSQLEDTIKQIQTLNNANEKSLSNIPLETLVNQVLQQAMKLLACSSGVLRIYDETSKELVIMAAAGPVGSDIKEKHTQIDHGIAGSSIEAQKSILINEGPFDPYLHNAGSPEESGKIRSILAYPLKVHDNVLGVLELFNKDSGLSFNKLDQLFIENFTRQAAGAIKKAMLKSEHEQTLEARLAELLTLQQIGRDLNTAQDINQALRGILRASIEYTSTKCGTIGLVDRKAGKLGNIWRISPGLEAPTPVDEMDLAGQAWFPDSISGSQRIHSPGLSEYFKILEDLSWHYPIYAKVDDDRSILLILHLQSSDQLADQDKSFLSRLTEHGLIALKNAILYEELHEVIQTKNEFISFISHELKNPLTVIKGYADILRKGMAGSVNEEQADYLATINHSVRQMNTFITDLSDQSHIETQSLRLEYKSTPVKEAINEVLQSYEAQINKKNLRVNTIIPKEIPDVWCDRLRLIQILSNLISNAIKYTPEGREITIGSEKAPNIWDEKGAAEVVHFWVEDQGYGISPEDQACLFGKFFRGTDIRIKKIPGTGLGLRISRSLTMMMGGKMWFESKLDEGSTFHFTIPI